MMVSRSGGGRGDQKVSDRGTNSGRGLRREKNSQCGESSSILQKTYKKHQKKSKKDRFLMKFACVRRGLDSEVCLTIS
jgi:hypothetical protein